MNRFFVLALLLVSCTETTRSCSKVQVQQQPSRPEEVVRLFVTLSAQVHGVGDKEKLSGLTQGRMRKAFDSISEDAFRISYVNQPLQLKDFTVIDSSTDGNLARVHYQVIVDNPNGQDHTEETSEREVELLRVDGEWYLEAIRPKGSDQIAFTRGMIF